MNREDTVEIHLHTAARDIDPTGLRLNISRALDHLNAPWAEVGVVLTNDADIQKLNNQYRQVDKPTDVLSFPALEEEALARLQEQGGASVQFAGEDGPYLGDIAISLERAEVQARERGASLSEEVTFLALHGLLHLLGIHHDTERDAEYREKIDQLTTLVLGRTIPH